MGDGSDSVQTQKDLSIASYHHLEKLIQNCCPMVPAFKPFRHLAIQKTPLPELKINTGLGPCW